MRANFLAQAHTKSPRAHLARYAGAARCGRRTKALAKRLGRGDIAIIDHEDLDSVAAQMLVDRNIAAVVNLSKSISGKYPNRGPSILLQAGIGLLDFWRPELMDTIKEGSLVEIQDSELTINGMVIGVGQLQTHEVVAQRLLESHQNLHSVLDSFARNTLEHASQELTQLLAPVHAPDVKIKIQDRHALVVVRGEGYKKDLQIIRGYLMGEKPVLIGVDGGADALMEMGLKPDIIIGDMDSVSDRALMCGAEIIVHTYTDERPSPGLERVQGMGLDYKMFAVPGTSEDAAMLLAFEHGAELIVAVGTHSNLYDFLDKGRQGMASTLLVRMRIGSRLVDARGVSKLYSSHKPTKQILLLLVAGLLLVAVLVQGSKPLQSWLEMISNTFGLKVLEWRILGRP